MVTTRSRPRPPTPKVKGVHFKWAKNKEGAWVLYAYHRAAGVKIKAPHPTPDFWSEYAELQRGTVRAPAPDETTLGGLVSMYLASPRFSTLAERTQSDYRDRLLSYIKEKGWEGQDLKKLTKDRAIRLRDVAFADKKRAFANYLTRVLCSVYNWALKETLTVDVNPFAGIDDIRRPHGERAQNRAWTKEEADIVLAAAPPPLLPAIALGRYAGITEGDALRLPWSAYNGVTISFVRRKTGVPVVVGVRSELKAILEATPRHATEIVTNRRGRPFTEDGFRGSFFKLIRRLKLKPGLTFHGLRHTVGKELADNGADTRDIMAVLGHATPAMSHHYTQEADRALRAKSAIERLETGKNSGDVVGKISEVSR